MVNANVARQPYLDQAADDLRWLERCRAGDEAALSELVSRHRVRLIRVAKNILRDAYDAEDVAQEAFIKAFRELHNLRDDRAFSGFLYRICVRLCMDKLRSRRTLPIEYETSEQDRSASIENKLIIRRLLKQLSPDLRTTLVLREMEQLSYEEVAEVMHVPIGTVRSRLHAAREKFRKLWLEANGEGF